MRTEKEIFRLYKTAREELNKLPLETREDFNNWRVLATIMTMYMWVSGDYPTNSTIPIIEELLKDY